MRNWDDPEYKKWRYAVRRRDKGKCQYPGCNSRKKLKTHHIQRWADNPILRYEVSNGITLCRFHHDMVWNNEDSYMPVFMAIIAQQ